VVGPFAVSAVTDIQFYALWCALAMAVGRVDDGDVLGAVWGLMPPPPDSEGVALCAESEVFAMNARPDAVGEEVVRCAIVCEHG